VSARADLAKHTVGRLTSLRLASLSSVLFS